MGGTLQHQRIWLMGRIYTFVLWDHSYGGCRVCWCSLYDEGSLESMVRYRFYNRIGKKKIGIDYNLLLYRHSTS